MPQADARLIGELAVLTRASRSDLQRILREPWRFYRCARVPKKDGTLRPIRAPVDSLKEIQRTLLARCLSKLDSHPANHCRRGRSVITNAQAHLKHPYVAAYDLERAFPATRPHMVRAALERDGFGEVVAEGVTRLCTLHRELPQGAPTSPALLSAVLRPLDDALAAETARHGLIYTRYMDDLFVSGGRRAGTFEAFLRAQVRNAGYKIAEDKIKTWSLGSRATLAGIVLGTVPSPTAEFVESVTMMVRNVESGELKDPKSMACLRGKVGWIRALWPQKGKALFARLLAVRL